MEPAYWNEQRGYMSEGWAKETASYCPASKPWNSLQALIEALPHVRVYLRSTVPAASVFGMRKPYLKLSSEPCLTKACWRLYYRTSDAFVSFFSVWPPLS